MRVGASCPSELGSRGDLGLVRPPSVRDGRGWGHIEAGAPLSLCFCSRLIRHTKGLMESEEKLCVKVLRTLQQMLLKKNKYGDRVSVADIAGQGQALTRQDLAYPKPHFILPGQPATEDAAAELPPEPQVWRPGRAH